MKLDLDIHHRFPVRNLRLVEKLLLLLLFHQLLPIWPPGKSHPALPCMTAINWAAYETCEG